jgi:hypothetical protein
MQSQDQVPQVRGRRWVQRRKFDRVSKHKSTAYNKLGMALVALDLTPERELPSELVRMTRQFQVAFALVAGAVLSGGDTSSRGYCPGS